MAVVRGPLPRLSEPEFFLIDPVEVPIVDVFGGITGEATLLMRGEVRDIHVATALEAEHRAIWGKLRGARAFGGELHAPVSQRVDVVVGNSGAAKDLLEI